MNTCLTGGKGLAQMLRVRNDFACGTRVKLDMDGVSWAWALRLLAESEDGVLNLRPSSLAATCIYNGRTFHSS